MTVKTTSRSHVKEGLVGEATFSHTTTVFPNGNNPQEVFWYDVVISGHEWRTLQLGRDIQPVN